MERIDKEQIKNRLESVKRVLDADTSGIEKFKLPRIKKDKFIKEYKQLKIILGE
jgi:hypothetical protein